MLLQIAILGLISNVLSTNCPHNWTPANNGVCLKAFRDRLAYNEARDQCKNLGGDLIKVTDESTNSLARVLVGEETNFWIGVRDLHKNRQFTYLDGSQLQYNNWRPGEPNNKETAEFCVMVKQKGGERGWNDAQCVIRWAYVCQKSSFTSGVPVR